MTIVNPQAPALRLIDVSLCYQGKLLFHHLNLHVSAAAWTVLLGPSGVGKTSLLRLIAGLTSDLPKAQLIFADDNLPLAERIAYLPQQDLLMPWLNVLDNALVAVKLSGKMSEEKRQRAYYLLNQVGLGNVIQQRPAQLSGGMRQRVSLVRTLLEEKPIVLMDEPFSALDAVTRLELQELAANLLTKQTVLLVTHDPLEALRLGDNLYIMQGQPATLQTVLQPVGKIPRDIKDPQLLQLQAELLTSLVHAKGVTPC
jgi:putative hydroxymethylpyrimidine transport system ATP-binding protein